MKVVLVEPAPPGVHVFSKLRFPRLGLPLIGATLKAAGHEVIIYAEDLAPIDWEELLSAKLVGISTTTSTTPRGYEIADKCREAGIPVIFGGAHVTFTAWEALQHCDYVARFEGGDQVMLELIEYLSCKKALGSIHGLSYRLGEKIHNNLPRGPVNNLDDLPFPDLTLIVGHERITSTPIMTSWGCPFDCDFCSVTAMFGRRYRFRSPENVIAELVEKKPKNVFFYDDNFAANPKRLKILLAMMIDQGLNINWSAQVRTDVTDDPELLDLMARSGCWQVYLGLESINQDTLDGYHKSQSVEDIIRGVTLLRLHGIKSHGMFVLGADSDGKKSVHDTVDFAIRHKISTVMLNILTPLPGTDFYQEMDESGRIIDHDWAHYDAHHVVFSPKQLTPYKLQREVIKGYVRFYSLPRLIKAYGTFRKAKIKLATWGFVTVRDWLKDAENRQYVRRLKNWKR